MDNRKIKTILDELYQIDKSMADHENDLVKIIEKLLKNKPDIWIDEKFVDRLRSEVLELVVNKNLNTNPANALVSMGTNFMRKFSYLFGGVAVTVVVVLLIINFLPSARETSKIAFAPTETKKLSDNAFGNLIETSSKEINVTDSSSIAPEVAKGLGGGGGFVRTQSGGGGGESSIMPYPEQVVYKYVYKGAGINLELNKMEVYRKKISTNFGSQLNNLDLKLIDLSKFSGTTLKSFNIRQDENLGYDIYVDLENGFISVNNNSQGWYDYNMVCQTDECAEENRLELSDVPSDDNLIAIADQFIKEKNIDISQYGKPKVEDFWKKEYEMASDKRYAYIPDSIGIVYPFLVSNQEVKDTSGNDYGLRVNVNIRYNKVSNLYGLGIYDLESSMYEAVTDEEKVLSMAEKGGYGFWYGFEGAKIVEIEIGEPTFSYTSYMRWDGEKNDELFIPALIFPITTQPEETYYFRRNVVVPLIEEFFDNNNGLPRPEPMPLLKERSSIVAPPEIETTEIEGIIKE